MMDNPIIVRGGGDIASGVVIRLYRCGLKIVITELQKPLCVRRTVSFAEAVFTGETRIEDVSSIRVFTLDEIHNAIEAGLVPVIVDPDMQIIQALNSDLIIDARLTKSTSVFYPRSVFSVGLGPGFVAGETCNAVVETNRGHRLGRVYWQGTAEADSGVPERVGEYESERVLKSPGTGKILIYKRIGDLVVPGDLIAEVSGQPINCEFPGVVRGLIHEGVDVSKNMKIGDIDPRNDPDMCYLVSDKALAIGGGVLEALLTRNAIRERLWS